MFGEPWVTVMAELEEGYIWYRGLDISSESDEVEATELVSASDSEAEDDVFEVEPETRICLHQPLLQETIVACEQI